MKAIKTIRKLRETTVNIIADLSLEELNKVPAGFNNNIIWNIGHMVAAQQGICYKRAGLPIIVDESYFERYKPGSKPEKPVTQEEVEEIKSLLFSTLDQLEKDHRDGIFKDYGPFVTRYGVELASVEDAIEFLPFHDGFHMGYLLALKRANRDRD
jgi:hypothetical protein